jgi:hypothetical protein
MTLDSLLAFVRVWPMAVMRRVGVAGVIAFVGLAVLSAGSQASSGGTRHQRFFFSPSGNIECEIDSGLQVGTRALTRAFCESSHPPQSATLHRNGHVAKCAGIGCLSNAPEHTPTLAYGRKVTLGPFRCASLRKGMRCTVVPSGHGFLISRSGIARF